jgi:hypothetical protein
MLQERAGHSEPDPTRASRDERNLVFDIFHLMMLLIPCARPWTSSRLLEHEREGGVQAPSLRRRILTGILWNELVSTSG